MEQSAYLIDVLIILAAAVVAAAIFQRLRTSVVLGYLLAGIVIGKSGLGLVERTETIAVLAEMGVVFLLFTVGLELPLQRLKTLRAQMAKQGVGQIALSTALLSATLYVFGIEPGPAILLGASLSLSSTALVLRLLSETREISTRFGRNAVAVLLTQDLAVAAMLIAVGFLARAGEASFWQGGLSLVLLLAALAGLVILGRIFLRLLFTYIAARGSPEVFTACTLLVVLGSALVSESAGLSLGLGAFVAGMLVADTSYRHQVAADILPFRVLLLGLFFLTVGLSIDLALVAEEPGRILLYLVVLLALKAASVAALSRLAGFTLGEALRHGLLLSQAGEFSLVLIAAGLDGGLLASPLAESFAVTVVLSMILTPFLAMIGQALQQGATARQAAQSTAERDLEGALTDHVVIAGFGRLGEDLAERLGAQNKPFIAVDLNGQVVARAHGRGIPILFGDATRPEILEALHVERASAIAICISDPVGTLRLVALVHYIFPELRVIARAYDEEHAEELRRAGASEVISELSPTSRQFERSLTR